MSGSNGIRTRASRNWTPRPNPLHHASLPQVGTLLCQSFIVVLILGREKPDLYLTKYNLLAFMLYVLRPWGYTLGRQDERLQKGYKYCQVQ